MKTNGLFIPLDLFFRSGSGTKSKSGSANSGLGSEHVRKWNIRPIEMECFYAENWNIRPMEMEIFYEQMEFVSTEIYEDVWTFIQDIPRQDNLGQC